MNEKPFVFVSYAHLDRENVIPCIEAMQNNGINIWYDNGIQAGSEWPEYIAQKVVACERFVLFVSDAYLTSQNCKRELNFAISRKKEILSIYLEDVELTPGMEMQLGTYQAIRRSRFAGDTEAFVDSIGKEKWFDNCREGSVITETPQIVSARESMPIAGKPEDVKAKLPKKNRYVASALAIFGGWLGLHNFYMRRPVFGIIYILLCRWFISPLLGIIEGILIQILSDERLKKIYKCDFSKDKAE